jgi:Predicted metal-dependent hydrolase of the TIM-barrel fold
MIVDSHQHLMFPIEHQIEKMDNARVDRTILFCTTPHPERANTYLEFKTEMGELYKILAGNNNKEANMQRMRNNIQEVVQAIREYPDRFYGFGSVPVGLTLDQTNDWIEKYIISNGLKGIGEFTPGSDEQMLQLETIFQALERYPNLPIWIHTFNPLSINGLKILMELTQKYPKTPVIFGHMGGYYWMDVLDFARNQPNVFIDLSAAFSTLAVRMAITELPDKCLYSSDAPYGEPLLSKQLIELESPSLAITNRVLGENMMEIIEKVNVDY